MGGVSTASKEPLEEATGPVAVTGGENMASLMADCVAA